MQFSNDEYADIVYISRFCNKKARSACMDGVSPIISNSIAKLPSAIFAQLGKHFSQSLSVMNALLYKT